jgi:predicted enzyme related to lactoylglutathione lyase
MSNPLKGIATVNLWSSDHPAAVTWYAKLFEKTPYFERPGYAEFRIGNHETEIGIIDRAYAPHMEFPNGPSGIIVYWHVDTVEETYRQLLRLGAASVEQPTNRGQGFVTATVLDPFGNVLGIMHNPHFAKAVQ